MPTPPDTREAVTKLLIALTDLGEAAFHLDNARKRVKEAAALVPASTPLGLALAALNLLGAIDRPRVLFHDMRSSILTIAAVHYPEVLTEEI